MPGEWRCQLCDEPVAAPGAAHANCPKDLTPGAYWCDDANQPRLPARPLLPRSRS